MKRIITYRIDTENENRTIERFLQRKGYSAGILAALKEREESVLLNGERRRMKQKLHTGDELTVTWMEEETSEGILPVPMPVDLLYEDEDLLIVNKPAGLAMHPSHGNPDHTLANAVMDLFARRSEPFVYRCINRLDQDTSGLTILARHSISAAVLGRMVRDKEQGIRRIYLAAAEGSFEKKRGTVNAPLVRVEDIDLRMAVTENNDGKPAVTHYRVLSEGSGCSLMECALETGRTHQIRVHMAYLGHPLLGDAIYGCPSEMISRQALHAWKLQLPHPITGEELSFSTEPPEDMRKLCDELQIPFSFS